MERRIFLKAGTLAIFSLYGFPEKIFGFPGEKLPAAGEAHKGQDRFTGVYANAIANDRVLMPDAFSRLLPGESLFLVVPEGNRAAYLMPENSPEWKALKQIFDAADKDVPGILRERAVIDKGGNLYLPRRLRKFAGIQTPTVTIIGRGNVIEIVGSEVLNP